MCKCLRDISPYAIISGLDSRNVTKSDLPGLVPKQDVIHDLTLLAEDKNFKEQSMKFIFSRLFVPDMTNVRNLPFVKCASSTEEELLI